MKFARVGGLSPVNQKGNYGRDTYHAAPAKFGTYAFIYPYIELFLVLWNGKNKNELKHNGIRYFEYDGPLWTYLDCVATLNRGGWRLTDTGTLEKAVKKEYASRVKQRKTMFLDFMKEEERKNLPSWYFGNNNARNISWDHLEVFIPKKI
jgi:hypothetical protein